MKTHRLSFEQFEITYDVSYNQECILYCIIAWHIFRLQIEGWPRGMEGLLHMYWISIAEQLTRGGPPAVGIGWKAKSYYKDHVLKCCVGPWTETDSLKGPIQWKIVNNVQQFKSSAFVFHVCCVGTDSWPVIQWVDRLCVIPFCAAFERPSTPKSSEVF